VISEKVKTKLLVKVDLAGMFPLNSCLQNSLSPNFHLVHRCSSARKISAIASTISPDIPFVSMS
jgi:hypothetical protein